MINIIKIKRKNYTSIPVAITRTIGQSELERPILTADSALLFALGSIPLTSALFFSFESVG